MQYSSIATAKTCWRNKQSEYCLYTQEALRKLSVAGGEQVDRSLDDESVTRHFDLPFLVASFPSFHAGSSFLPLCHLDLSLESFLRYHDFFSRSGRKTTNIQQFKLCILIACAFNNFHRYFCILCVEFCHKLTICLTAHSQNLVQFQEIQIQEIQNNSKSPEFFIQNWRKIIRRIFAKILRLCLVSVQFLHLIMKNVKKYILESIIDIKN